MSDEDRIKVFRENPDLFRLHLLNAFKECIGGIKERMEGSILGNYELPSHVENTFVSTISEHLNHAFSTMNLETLMRKLIELEKNSSSESAWRPKTGVVDVSGEREYALLKRKQLLQSKIEELDSEAEHLKQIITSKRKALKVNYEELEKQIRDINNFDE